MQLDKKIYISVLLILTKRKIDMAVYTYCRDRSTTKPKKIFVAVLIASAFEPNSETHDRSGIPMIVQYKFVVYWRLAIPCEVT